MISEAWNHFYLVVFLYVGWTIALGWMGGKKVFLDYDSFPDESEQPAEKATT